jgi:hypothetical protein
MFWESGEIDKNREKLRFLQGYYLWFFWFWNIVLRTNGNRFEEKLRWKLNKLNKFWVIVREDSLRKIK